MEPTMLHLFVALQHKRCFCLFTSVDDVAYKFYIHRQKPLVNFWLNNCIAATSNQMLGHGPPWPMLYKRIIQWSRVKWVVGSLSVVCFRKTREPSTLTKLPFIEVDSRQKHSSFVPLTFVTSVL